MAPRRSSSLMAWTCSLLVMMLLAGCGGSDSGGGAAGQAPTANAGSDETAAVGTAITLDGSASEGPAGAPVSYQWILTSKPSGSTASLTSPTSARPTFTPDVAGAYTATLVVHANGVASQPDTVSITCSTGNIPPRANAGPDRSAAPGGAITLDGTGSRDPNNTSLTYSWRIVTQPSGTNPVLSNATTATPTFRADVPGVYTVALTVSDGSLTSATDQVNITVATGNLPPVANAGPDQTVTTGQRVTLDGTGSTDPNGDPLTYSWCLRGRPQGSTATLNGANTAQPTMQPDVAGSYVLCLTVNDGQSGSASDSVVVEARLPSSVSGVLQAYVKASNTTAQQFRGFGRSVALHGNSLVVAADEASCATGMNGDQTNSGCPRAGAVYVFSRVGDTWSQQAYLKASNTEAEDFFGQSVSISGDTLAVGAMQEASCAAGVNGNQADNGCPSRGAVYVFTRSGTTWSQQAYLKPSNPSNFFAFGGSFFPVIVSGNTLVVGAPDEASCATGINGNQAGTGCQHTGAVYVFTRNNNVWTQEAYLKASNHSPVSGEAFGSTVALDGDTLAVGAAMEEGCSSGINGEQINYVCNSAGAVYVFTRTAGVWTQQAYVKASNTDLRGGAGDQFGRSLAVKGDTLVVGAHLEDSCSTGINGDQADEGCDGAGAVYVFTRSNNVWTQQAYVKAVHPGLQSFAGGFGTNLAFDGTTLAVSAVDGNCARGFNPSPASNDCTASGAVYLFTRTATSWAQRAYVKASNTEAFDFFGGAGGFPGGVAIDGSTLVVGASTEDSCATGINGNQNDNSCTGFPFQEFDAHLFGAGAAYVYVLE